MLRFVGCSPARWEVGGRRGQRRIDRAWRRPRCYTLAGIGASATAPSRVAARAASRVSPRVAARAVYLSASRQHERPHDQHRELRLHLEHSGSGPRAGLRVWRHRSSLLGSPEPFDPASLISSFRCVALVVVLWLCSAASFVSVFLEALPCLACVWCCWCRRWLGCCSGNSGLPRWAGLVVEASREAVSHFYEKIHCVPELMLLQLHVWLPSGAAGAGAGSVGALVIQGCCFRFAWLW